jgi:hypothetical protein
LAFGGGGGAVAEGVEHLWTTADLAAALLHGTRLPGEPTGPPPWPDYLDVTYRRQTAATVLGRRAGRSPDCFGPLAFVAGRDDDEDVRLRCLEQLFEAGYPFLEGLLVALSYDPADRVRQLALEGLGLRDYPSLRAVAERLAGDPDPDIRVQAASMLAGESWPLWRL